MKESENSLSVALTVKKFTYKPANEIITNKNLMFLDMRLTRTLAHETLYYLNGGYTESCLKNISLMIARLRRIKKGLKVIKNLQKTRTIKTASC